MEVLGRRWFAWRWTTLSLVSTLGATAYGLYGHGGTPIRGLVLGLCGAIVTNGPVVWLRDYRRKHTRLGLLRGATTCRGRNYAPTLSGLPTLNGSTLGRALQSLG